MKKQENLVQSLHKEFPSLIIDTSYDEVTMECERETVIKTLKLLRDRAAFAFDQLIDLCAVDYLCYGVSDWQTESATSTGFSRAVNQQQLHNRTHTKPRFAVVYHLLSTKKNHRLRVKIFLNEDDLILPSVIELWKVADWFEREAYDLYGILFEGHPDLRRILTDYGFIGHPFRKDFPVSGHVEMRYDATLKKVIYEPVDIEPRVTVPKVIRHDNRYQALHEIKQD